MSTKEYLGYGIYVEPYDIAFEWKVTTDAGVAIIFTKEEAMALAEYIPRENAKLARALKKEKGDADVH